MKHKVILLIVLISSHIYSQNIDLNIGKVTSKKYYEEIGFEFIKDKIIIPVSIEGKEYKFILDTGAPNIISNEINNLISPELIQTIPVSDASGKKENLKVVSVKKLMLGNIEFINTATLVYDLNSNPIFKCFGIDGFIGSNMLRKSIIQIDSKKKILTITDSQKKLSLNKKESIKIKLIGNQSSPYIWINLKGLDNGKENVLIDTGMDGLYDVSKRNYQIFKEKEIFNVTGKSKGASSLSLFGDVPVNEHYELLLPSLKLVDTEFENVVTHTTNDNNSRIGAELLEYGIMTIDFKHKRFYFKSNSRKINLNDFGFGFTRTLKDEKLIIGFVWDQELKSKLSYGDEIIEINGKPVNICNLITKNIINKNDKTLKMKIKPKKGELFEISINKKTIANSGSK
ncbi:aspartyl protease family protein [Tenacibaculum tangerinum]|uniref:Aspartyl protease family protein n=1 Tax=Tenacibaculum tangerinum TaxID=3038772 RepID=A0ABY8L687_9FLAO|nr:aspartyl protease family protein [Tenacibaculum tangerinum]WGH76791.1 aspartyl protease family protein [Tenacibaculum tangerinum]